MDSTVRRLLRYLGASEAARINRANARRRKLLREAAAHLRARL